MKTFKVTKTKTQTFKPTNIKSLTEFNGDRRRRQWKSSDQITGRVD